MNLHILLEVEVGKFIRGLDVEKLLEGSIWDDLALVLTILEFVFLDI
mgnify:CR=1 FL=1